MSSIGLRIGSGPSSDRVLFRQTRAKASRGRSLYRWHWHLGAWPRVPNTVWRSSQLTAFAGTTEIADSVAVIRTIMRPWTPCRPDGAAGRLIVYGPLVDAVVANTSVRFARLPLLARTWNGLKPGLDPLPAKSRPA